MAYVAGSLECSLDVPIGDIILEIARKVRGESPNEKYGVVYSMSITCKKTEATETEKGKKRLIGGTFPAVLSQEFLLSKFPGQVKEGHEGEKLSALDDSQFLYVGNDIYLLRTKGRIQVEYIEAVAIPKDIVMGDLYPRTDDPEDKKEKPSYKFTFSMSAQGEIDVNAASRKAQPRDIALLKAIQKVLEKKN